MCLFLESIRIDHGQPENLMAHQQRMDATVRHFFGQRNALSLEDLVVKQLADSQNEFLKQGLYKMRLVYSQQPEEVSFVAYRLPIIESLQCVEDNQVEYRFKFADRSALNVLFAQRGQADDILILKKGLITDTSYANVAFFDGTCWFTPREPLLAGTRRASLLAQNIISPTDISPNELGNYQKIRLFNAMIRWEDAIDIQINNIFR